MLWTQARTSSVSGAISFESQQAESNTEEAGEAGHGEGEEAGDHGGFEPTPPVSIFGKSGLLGFSLRP